MFDAIGPITIRIALPNDSAVIAALHAASWKSAYKGILSDAYLHGDNASERMALWDQRLYFPKAGQYVAVAEDEPQIVGFACAYGDEDQRWGTWLDNLHISPARTRQGIGRKLMAHLALWCSETCSSKGLFLWVFERNLPARRFYERLGGMAAEETTWTAPDGTAVPDLRYAWKDINVLTPDID
jgi:GNAT superfamily N-acetyltransferase